jgi:hypothetical protein
MRPDDLLRLIRAQPFQPFRIHLTNGRTYDVRHPDLAVVGRSTMFVGAPAADLTIRVYDQFDIVSLLHINHIEPLPQTAQPPSPNGPA